MSEISTRTCHFQSPHVFVFLVFDSFFVVKLSISVVLPLSHLYSTSLHIACGPSNKTHAPAFQDVFVYQLGSPSCRHCWPSVAHSFGIDKGFVNTCSRLNKCLQRQERLCRLMAPSDSSPICDWRNNCDLNSFRMLRNENLVFPLPGYFCAVMSSLAVKHISS